MEHTLTRLTGSWPLWAPSSPFYLSGHPPSFSKLSSIVPVFLSGKTLLCRVPVPIGILKHFGVSSIFLLHSDQHVKETRPACLLRGSYENSS